MLFLFISYKKCTIDIYRYIVLFVDVVDNDNDDGGDDDDVVVVDVVVVVVVIVVVDDVSVNLQQAYLMAV